MARTFFAVALFLSLTSTVAAQQWNQGGSPGGWNQGWNRVPNRSVGPTVRTLPPLQLQPIQPIRSFYYFEQSGPGWRGGFGYAPPAQPIVPVAPAQPWYWAW